MSQDRRARVLAAVDGLDATTRLEPTGLARAQAAELGGTLRHAQMHSAWWRERLANIEWDAPTPTAMLADLPITTREFAQDNLDDMVVTVSGTPASDYPVQKTTGSSGRPVQVVKYWPHYSVVVDAITLLEWRWHRRDITKRVGLFRLGATDSDALPAGPPLAYLGDPPPMFARSSVDRTVDELLDALVRHTPAYLLTNPVTLDLVAREQLHARRPVGGLEQVMTLADRVTPELRELTREAFGARIVDRYSSVEFNVIALQCPEHDHLHQVSPNVHVEVLDEYDRPVPVGTPGRAVITGLQGVAMPMLRYEQDDIITMGGPCDTGITWPVIEQVQGRVRTTAVAADGQRRLVTLFTADFLYIRDIREFRVVRFDDGVVFIAQMQHEPDSTTVQRIVKSLQRDVFREPVEVTILWRSEPLSAPRWKRQELYFLPGPRDPRWTIDDVDALLAAHDATQVAT